jgi:CBS domain-containing protein
VGRGVPEQGRFGVLGGAGLQGRVPSDSEKAMRGRTRTTIEREEAPMKVREAMTPKAEWVSPDLTLQEIAKKMRDKNIGALPVGEHDRLIGMVTDRDVCCRAVAEGRDPAKTTVREVMSKKISFCFDDQDLADAAHMMEEKQIRRLAVLNRDKRIVGMLSLDDFASHGERALAGEVLEKVAAHMW